MGAIVTFIVSVAKAVPAARAIFEQSVALYYANEQHQDDNHTDDVREEREALVASLKQPGLTDANKRALYKRLIALMRE
jgi:hypothetical protein